jgi:hypothetical protein
MGFDKLFLKFPLKNNLKTHVCIIYDRHHVKCQGNDRDAT